MRRILTTLLACLVMGGVPGFQVAAGDSSSQETTSQGATLKRGPRTERSDVGVPGAGRIVVVFVLIAALSAAVIVALRRMPQRLWRRDSVPGSIQILDRARASATMQVYLVRVERTRIMIAEGRNSTGVVVLSTEDRPGADKA